ncbi:TPA: filamentous hemagglutinin N-terminal domain-containing protein [Salmonella enterica]|nr:filamentous hemagglutinin N-terminal domain-containing protein [Salmonella enterica]
MNKIYKLKYDRRRNQLVAVSELTTGAGKEATGSVAGQCGLQGVSTFRRLLGTLTPLAVMTGLVIGMLPGLALANPDLPVGGQVVAGQGSISTSGNQMTIHQGTHGLVTNWNSFDIGQNHTVQFVQPDSSAVALNRVTGGHESQILGTLTANGRVMLVNPAGVMFGKGAKVNTAGLVASTKNISTEDFMAGRYTFSGGSHPGAEIVNQGSLTTTKGGYIVLAADRVRNSGTLSAPGGRVVLAAADRVTLQLDNTGLASVSVNGSVVNALVENSGLIAATNGQVYLTARGKDMLLNTVVNNSGTVEARGLNQRGGEIVLDGGDSGVVNQSGMLLADSDTGRGGKITVQGANIHLAGGSRASATGRTGGGGVYVGGGWQGKDAAIRNASKVVMDRDAVIDVSATEKGDGGKAVLWSEDYTNFRGRILAKGGAQSGNGGQVETSSHHNLQAFGDVEASALNGRGGNWLLDPLDVTIVSGSSNTNVTETGKGTEAKLDSDTDHVFSPSAAGAMVSAVKIADQLNNGTSVTVDTHGTGTQGGNITVNADITKDKGGDATLTLTADKNITVNNNITATSPSSEISSDRSTGNGKLNVVLRGGGNSDGVITVNSTLSTNGGDVTIGAVNGNDSTPPAHNVSVYLTDRGSLVANNVSITGSGKGLIPNSDNKSFKDSAIFSNGVINATGDITLTSTGKIILRSNITGRSITANATSTGTDKALGVWAANITATGGNISLTGNASGTPVKGLDISGSKDEGQSTLMAESGTIILTGIMDSTSSDGKALALAGSTFKTGNLTISGQLASGSKGSVGGFTNATIKNDSGSLNITATNTTLNFVNTTVTARDNLNISASSGGQVGINFDNSALTAMNMNITGVSTPGRADSEYDSYGGIVIFGNVNFTAGGKGVIHGVNNKSAGKGARVVGIRFGQLWRGTTTATFKGNFDVTGDAQSSAGNKAKAAGLFYSGPVKTHIIDGNLSLSATGTGYSMGISGMASGYDADTSVHTFVLNNANLSLNASSERSFAIDEATDGGGVTTGYVFSGNGNVSVNGQNNSDGATLQVNEFDNTALKGHFSIDATNDSGNAILVNGRAHSNVVNATINGHSKGGGKGVVIDASPATLQVNLGNNTITGDSVSGAGIEISGKNVSITNGTLSGTATSGNGVGVKLSGGSNYIVDGATVTGQSVAGSGVSVSGNLSVSNGTVNGSTATGSGVSITGNLKVVNTSVTGSASGSGNGVSLGGKISGDDADKNVITGNSARGDGVVITGNPEVDNITLHGNAVDGNGIKVTGSLTVNNTVATGNATGNGNGIMLAGCVTGGNWSGHSADGTGVHVDGDSTLTDVTVSGSTITGTGVDVSGSLTNAGSTTVKGEATGSGTGASVEGTLNGSIDSTSVSGSGAVVNGTVNGTVNSTSASGSGMVVGDGANITQGSQVNGLSGSGTGLSVEGNVTNGGSITGTTNGTGDGVNLAGNVSGGTVVGNADNGTGVSVSDDNTLMDVTVSGKTASGSGVRVSGSLTSQGTTTVDGTASGSGSGIHLKGDVKDGVLTGTSVSGPGVKTDGDVVLNNTTLTGNSGSNSGLLLNGMVMNTDSVLHGQSGSGDGVSLNGAVTGGSLSGQSGSGAGMHVTGNSTVSGVNVSASSGSGQGLQLDGVLSTAGGTTLNGVVQRDSSAERRQVYELQNRLSHNNRSLKQVVAISGYREQEKSVSVDICTDDQCHKLDAGASDRPAHP